VVNEGSPIALDMQVNGLPARPTAAPPGRDDLDGAAPGPAWNFLRNPERALFNDGGPRVCHSRALDPPMPVAGATLTLLSQAPLRLQFAHSFALPPCLSPSQTTSGGLLRSVFTAVRRRLHSREGGCNRRSNERSHH
jgi:hypothetical protein